MQFLSQYNTIVLYYFLRHQRGYMSNKKSPLLLLFIIFLLSAGHVAKAEEEIWAHEFIPKPNQVVTFQGYGDDGSLVTFTTIYYIRPSSTRETDYLLSEYNIFPEDIKDPGFVPRASVDYYYNEMGLMARTPFEKSQGISPCLVLPYKFSVGTAFEGCGQQQYIVTDINKNVNERGQSYGNCLEVVSGQGDQLYYMAETGFVLGIGGDERWLINKRYMAEEEIKRQFKIK